MLSVRLTELRKFSQAIFDGEGCKATEGNSHVQNMKRTVNLFEGDEIPENTFGLGYCKYGINIFPTSEFESSAHDETPALAAIVSSVIFLGIAFCFFAYDRFVQIRNHKIIDAAAKTNAIVLSLFPGHIRDQLLGSPEQAKPKKGHTPNGVKAYLENPDAISGKEAGMEGGKRSRPIAELFPATTIMFGDVSRQATGVRLAAVLSLSLVR